MRAKNLFQMSIAICRNLIRLSCNNPPKMYLTHVWKILFIMMSMCLQGCSVWHRAKHAIVQNQLTVRKGSCRNLRNELAVLISY